MGYTPGNELIHYHGLLRVHGVWFQLYSGKPLSVKECKGSDGKFHSDHIDRNRRMLGDKWNEIHNAFVIVLVAG